MKKKFTQKEIWQLTIDTLREWDSWPTQLYRTGSYREALEDILDDIELENNIDIPIPWRWKFRKRLNKHLKDNRGKFKYELLNKR